jgi:hypothetical protein
VSLPYFFLPLSILIVELESLNIWTKEGKRGIWLKIPIEKSQLIPVAVAVIHFNCY